MTSPPDLAAMRVRYGAEGLDVGDLAEDWCTQLQRWLAAAVAAGLPEPNAMVLATIAGDRPHSRTVLMKDLTSDGIAFYTNLDSDKARQIAFNPHVSLTFPWHAIGRQVQVVGLAGLLPDDVADAYFATRPREAQLGAWASPQSQRLGSRDELDERLADVTRQYPVGTAIPRPERWGGFLIVPRLVEFWQGRTGRLHDRLRYTRTLDDGWITERIAP